MENVINYWPFFAMSHLYVGNVVKEYANFLPCPIPAQSLWSSYVPSCSQIPEPVNTKYSVGNWSLYGQLGLQGNTVYHVNIAAV